MSRSPSPSKVVDAHAPSPPFPAPSADSDDEDLPDLEEAEAEPEVPRLTALEYKELGNAHYKKGEYTKAIVQYVTALCLFPHPCRVPGSKGLAVRHAICEVLR